MTYIMSLPDLPRVIKKTEANYTPRVLKWFAENYSGSCAIEIKATKGNSIPESALLPHQRRALLDACGRGITWKIPDEARRQVPFDAFKIEHAGAFVACVFVKHRVVIVYDVRDWHGSRFVSSNCYTRFPL